jgi:hypothetical protein
LGNRKGIYDPPKFTSAPKKEKKKGKKKGDTVLHSKGKMRPPKQNPKINK